jgi:hypothetical protein
MISQKDRIISRLKQFKVKHEVVNDNLITVFLLYINAKIHISGEKFRLEYGDEFVSKNYKRDMKRLKSIIKERRVVSVIQSLESFEDKYGS